jgi:hypothetical protein
VAAWLAYDRRTSAMVVRALPGATDLRHFFKRQLCSTVGFADAGL